MATLLLAPDKRRLSQEHFAPMIYDPCCGSGGMLTIAKEHIADVNDKAHVHLFGQEVNPETWAVSVADLLITSEKGRDAGNIIYGSTLSKDGHSDKRFDYLLTNPPYGYDWSKDEEVVRAEYERGDKGRFGAGLPRISDGQLLFLQHMLGRMKDPQDGGSRVAIIMNGSPLFTGDAGSGESEIRRWMSRTTGSRPLWPCPNSSSTTPVLRPTSGCCRTGRNRSARAMSSSSTPQRSGSRCVRASETNGARFRATTSSRLPTCTPRSKKASSPSSSRLRHSATAR
jgi:type I restriction enzyme M protein